MIIVDRNLGLGSSFMLSLVIYSLGVHWAEGYAIQKKAISYRLSVYSDCDFFESWVCCIHIGSLPFDDYNRYMY